MRVLLLFRGAPGCGKSTFIKDNYLEPYTLSADSLRMLYGSPILNKEGNEEIDQSLSNDAWNLLFEILERRMANGEFTVIDAVNSKTTEMNRYKDLCERYRYRCYCIDMTDIDPEEVKRRNRQRIGYKVVPEFAIDKIYARFKTQKIPGRIKVIKPDELDTVWGTPADYNGVYKKIHVIGDIHGCYTALKKYIEEFHGSAFNEDELFIFLGDYLDRGIENAETFAYLYELSQLKNIVFLEGNHEHHLNDWGHDCVSVSKEFEFHTRPQLEEGGISRSDAKQFYRKLWQMAHFYFGDWEFLITHGGLSCMPDNLTLVPTKTMIKGVGNYKDSVEVDNAFMQNTVDCIQIHGHRNVDDVPIEVNDCCYNLEGKVEFGGCLRGVTIYPDGKIETHEMKNDVFKEFEPETDDYAQHHPHDGTVGDMVLAMRASKLIKETKEGEISSFNFTREAFQNKEWNSMTTRARGLFVDVPNERIIARAYDKFFNIGEREETKLEWLKRKFVFPVTAYRKENGFLGLVSYDPYKDDLFIASKSSTTGSHAGYIREILEKTVSKEAIEAIKGYAKENNVTFVFEVIDPVNDPHIIEYPKQKLVLLNVVRNYTFFEAYSYEETQVVANTIGVECKEKAAVFNDWTEFNKFYNECHKNDYLYDGKEIEGFVLEDANGYMTKMKLNYYNFWKFMRMVAQIVGRQGYMHETSRLTTPIMNMFYGFLRRIKEEGQDIRSYDIIGLRNAFLESEEGKEYKGKILCDYEE